MNKDARILIACEESGTVTGAFRALGFHNTFSYDILPTSSGHPEWHIQGDVVPALEQHWDMIIAFPPCTHLAVSGAKYFAQKRLDGRQQAGIEFFMQFTKLNCRWAIENPVGIMSTIYRKPDQIINPFQYGDPVSKKTCLWLHGLPLLQSTGIVEGSRYIKSPSGRSYPQWQWKTGGGSGKKRSVFFPGIARAMSEQWSLVGVKTGRMDFDRQNGQGCYGADLKSWH